MTTIVLSNTLCEISMITVGPFQTNHYLIKEKASQHGWLFDCGFEPARIEQWIEDQAVQLQSIWLTHGHIDHAAASETIATQFGVPFYLHDDDVPLTANLSQQAQMFGLQAENPRHPDGSIPLGAVHLSEFLYFEALHTPGHSPGSISFYFPQLECVIVGDALFHNSIGRTDLPGGSHPVLINSIKQQLLPLPENTLVLAGHMDTTTIGNEKRYNPFLT